jgi:RHS repeat-associated protein
MDGFFIKCIRLLKVRQIENRRNNNKFFLYFSCSKIDQAIRMQVNFYIVNSSECIASKTGGGIIDIVAIIRELLANMSAWKLAFEPLWTNQFKILPPEIKKEASWISNSAGQPIQHLQYLPFGELQIDQRVISWHTRYTFSGKEKDEESPYSYFGARYYDSDLSIWLSVDPMASKYPGLTPYNYCANNPIKLVDPNGEEVIAGDEQSRSNIKNTLTKAEAKYVRFDKNGKLDTRLLNKSKSTSENMTALKGLAQSESKYIFSTASEYSNDGTMESLVGDNANGIKGVTLIPGAESDPSPDGNIHIIVSNKLSAEGQAKVTAHEAYGHAYFHELKQQGQNVNPYHDYQVTFLGATFDPDFNMDVPHYGRIDNNTKLDNQIKTVENQAVKNYQSRKKR